MKRIFSLKGFTLVEAMIGLAIVAILAGIAVPAFLNQREELRITKAKMDINNIAQAVAVFYYGQKAYPATLADAGMGGLTDPWGNAYEYWPITGDKNQKVRKDRNLHPINTDFDLCSKGKDGTTNYPLTALASHDDIIRANNGGFIGLASDY
jgi:general secretion pathway protein G